MELILKNCKLVFLNAVNIIEGLDFVDGLVQVNTFGNVHIVSASNYKSIEVDVKKYPIGTKFYFKNTEVGGSSLARIAVFSTEDSAQTSTFQEKVSFVEKQNENDAKLYFSVLTNDSGVFGVYPETPSK